jgi:hypothetical protein
MYTDKRISSDYLKGLSGFLQVAESNKPSSGFIMCSCKKCKNEKDYSSIKSLHDHLFKWGFMPNYFVWTKHGERGVIMEYGEEEDDTIPNWSQSGAFDMNQWERIMKKWKRIKDQMMLSVRCCERQRKIAGKM